MLNFYEAYSLFWHLFPFFLLIALNCKISVFADWSRQRSEQPNPGLRIRIRFTVIFFIGFEQVLVFIFIFLLIGDDLSSERPRPGLGIRAQLFLSALDRILILFKSRIRTLFLQMIGYGIKIQKF